MGTAKEERDRSRIEVVLQILRKQVPLTVKQFCTDACVERFLRCRGGGNVKKAANGPSTSAPASPGATPSALTIQITSSLVTPTMKATRARKEKKDPNPNIRLCADRTSSTAV